eukprot:scaffold995_cov358-Pavlova_lutheri.AAC.4
MGTLGVEPSFPSSPDWLPTARPSLLRAAAEVATPTSRAFKLCVQRFKTVLVDEFGTTMAHGGDILVMKQVLSGCKQAAARGLMWCGMNNGKFVNRDLNVAQNIRRRFALSVWRAKLYPVAVQGRM